MAYPRRCVKIVKWTMFVFHAGGGGVAVTIPEKWDMIIAHPPCTYLTDAGNRCYSERVTDSHKIIERMKKREEAIVFFMRCVLADCDKVVVENPKGRMNTVFRKPDQTIHPYMFAESEEDSVNYVNKRTCLWLKGVLPLVTNDLPMPPPAGGYRIQSTTGKRKPNTWTESQKGKDRQKLRSKTFPAVARAMAEQWG